MKRKALSEREERIAERSWRQLRGKERDANTYNLSPRIIMLAVGG